MTLAWWEGLLIGLVQGLTEFLPISSSGHLVLAEHLLGIEAQGVFLEVTVHVATLVSVVIVYRAKIAELIRDMVTGGKEGWWYVGLLLLASIPAGAVGILFRDYFERTFHSLPALGWNFLITAGLLWSTRYAVRRPPPAVESRVSVLQAVTIGLAQAVAILPGVSRSGATIAAGLWGRLAPARAAEFSFLMSIIVIAGSGLLEARHLAVGTQTITPGLVTAFLAALVAGIVAIRVLVLLLRRGKFHYFAPYCAALGILGLVWFGWLG